MAERRKEFDWISRFYSLSLAKKGSSGQMARDFVPIQS